MVRNLGSEKVLIPLSVAMVEPSQPVNVGHVARVAKNFGVEKLVLINPEVDIEEARIFAAHGTDILLAAENLPWNQLRPRFDLLVGTTAMRARKPSNLLRTTIPPYELARRLQNIGGKTCVVLGREATGLRNEELRECDIVVSIRTGTRYGTLNIGHAAAILLYELSTRRQIRTNTVSDIGQKQVLLRYAKILADRSEYPYHKASMAQRALSQILARSGATNRETSLITGLFRKALLALERSR